MELLEKSDCHIKPFIKWAGGKDKELEKLQSFFPKSYLRYNELLSLYNSDYRNGVDYFVSKSSPECFKLIVADGYKSELLINEIKKNLSSKIKRAKEIEKQKGKMPADEILANMECIWILYFIRRVCRVLGVQPYEHSSPGDSLKTVHRTVFAPLCGAAP